MAQQSLSSRQKKILSFIERFLEKNGYPPTIREIGEAVSIASTSVVNYNLNKLVERGFLERSPEVSRGLRLVKENAQEVPMRYAESASLLPVPLVGKIVASAPVPLPGEDFGYYYDTDDIIDVPQSLISRMPGDELFALRVNGDSMIDAMVADGDIVVLKRQNIAHNGDMVAVWLRERGEMTLKNYYNEGKQVRLQPANPTMDPIYVDATQVEVQGRVLAVLRTLH
ncbi:MAG TPA: transcriptional repressor LexA [Aggregatilinea sp.]|jgi:repressor LexA|uniref:transcriptional repressor LexA n=1 Tax=Aggregatilinea sp. TaxID=2806333 RepID=UPI002B81BA07|nr:transcriptional repressor LexA [Aggregatilinea sp.]HML24452.1 transcriptional repressor LexA [Aggregatilinea sp.]